MRRLLYLVPLAAFIAVAIWFAFGLTRDPSKVPSALLDRPIPEFTLPALAGVNVPGLGAETIRGKVAMVNVFASWCVPCKVEHPILMRLAAEKRVPIYGINWKDKGADAARWLAELGNPYAAIGHDESGRVGIEWGVYGAPETFIIDREGRVRYKYVGPITPAVLQETILPLIAQLEK
ncbi:MAG TPA: DsbE family thiol:disulfide interchange protein [Alphaproteobacteria bacterium]|nr:DsbE family thiol:disulfide interchange protein [Alphaproteobacteria bacterium]